MKARPSNIEKRDPPAYQTYASDDLASERYYSLPLSQRGLLDSIMRTCWVNGSAPDDPQALAFAIRSTVDEVREHLTQAVRDHFTVGEDGRLMNPELERQRSNMIVRQESLSRGAAKTNAKRWQPRDADADATSSGRNPGS